MAKVISFPNLATPTGAIYTSLEAALAQGVAATEASTPTVRSMSKADRRNYLKQSASNWPCLSLTEGVNPMMRISSDNPPQLLHGFAADYDSVGRSYTHEELAALASRCAYPPAIAGPSLSGEGVHALWLFREPIPVLGNTEYARKVLAVIYSKMRVGNFLSGFDEAFKKGEYLLSVDAPRMQWLFPEAANKVIDEVSTRMWAASVTKDFIFEGPVLDLVKVHEKVQQLFPGRWNGAFEAGTRGPRFWDATATDGTAAIVTATGMAYFSDGGGFKPWSSILGNDIVSKLSAESLGVLTESWYYDASNKDYILNDKATGTFHGKNRTQFFDRLELGGLGDDIERKRAVVYVEDHKRVTAVVSLANQPRGVINQGVNKFINATDTKPIKPVAGDCLFIRGLIDAMFVTEAHYFLGWLKHSVQSVLDAKPSYAQAVFLAGSVESGKSLLQFRVLTPLLGGLSCDPMDALLDESKFNSELAKAGHWLVSDREGAKNASQRGSFSQKIKAVAANPAWSIQAKYKEPITLFLNSRITFSFNKNDECLSVIPRLGDDILGKILLFNIHSHDFFKGMNQQSIEAAVEAALPGFCHWLINDYQVPDDIKATGRYPTKSYHSPELLNYAKACQDSSEILGWLNVMFTQDTTLQEEFIKPNKPAVFSAARWLQMITAACGGHNFGLTPNKLSAHFQNLAKQHPGSISSRLDPSSKVHVFSVDYNKLTSIPTTDANPTTTHSS